MGTQEVSTPKAKDVKSAPRVNDAPHNGNVMQVERADFTDLVPEGRAPVQGMEGFDPVIPISSTILSAARTRSGMSAT